MASDAHNMAACSRASFIPVSHLAPYTLMTLRPSSVRDDGPAARRHSWTTIRAVPPQCVWDHISPAILPVGAGVVHVDMRSGTGVVVVLSRCAGPGTVWGSAQPTVRPSPREGGWCIDGRLRWDLSLLWERGILRVGAGARRAAMRCVTRGSVLVVGGGSWIGGACRRAARRGCDGEYTSESALQWGSGRVVGRGSHGSCDSLRAPCTFFLTLSHFLSIYGKDRGSSAALH
ncbi:hypothetical protein BJ912DRAFT_38480 [Pholiota molesta]|nr:hypothetical protein BJ912DRAFT_38480 [Pholiota molesta]